MAFPHRSPQLPADRRARLAAADRRDVLAAVLLADGRWAAATRRALYVLGDVGDLRLTWAQVDHGSLDAGSGALAVRLVNGAALTLRLPAATGSRAFAGAFRERVQSSVVHTTSVQVPGGVVQVAVRRDEDGSLFTQVLGPGPVDLADPRVAALVEEAERAAREAVGLPA